MTDFFMYIFNTIIVTLQGEMSSLLIPDPSNINFPWCPKDKPKEKLELLSPLIQFNPQNSSFHIDPAGMPGFIAMSSYFSDETVKICIVAARNTTTLRRYLKRVAASLTDTKRGISQEIILSEVLDLVERGDMSMDILYPGYTAHFLKNALYHFVVSCYKEKAVGIANISFITGRYSAVAPGPPLLAMDPDQDPSDKYRRMVFSEAEIAKAEDDHKILCLDSTQSLRRARESNRLVKAGQAQRMLQNRKSSIAPS